MKIIIPKDCDNAPKRRIVKDFILSIFQNDWQEAEQMLEPNFKLISIGKNIIENLEAFKNHFSKIHKIEELVINEILSHGKLGACHGQIKLKNQVINFAFFIEFKSAAKNTIIEITEYQI